MQPKIEHISATFKKYWNSATNKLYFQLAPNFSSDTYFTVTPLRKLIGFAPWIFQVSNPGLLNHCLWDCHSCAEVPKWKCTDMMYIAYFAPDMSWSIKKPPNTVYGHVNKVYNLIFYWRVSLAFKQILCIDTSTHTEVAVTKTFCEMIIGLCLFK